MPPEERAEPRMTDLELRQLCELLRSHCGLSFGPETRYVLERRLLRRIRELELGSFSAYRYLLRSGREGDQELAHAVDELATNETYFFRERGQLDALIREVIPDLRERHGGERPLSIWSAGCSSGEEPYSVAMLALSAGLVPTRDFRVYAADISRRMLQKARRGVYRPASFRQTEPEQKARYFTEKDGLYRISDEVKRTIDFMHLNLLDRERIALLGRMDVILCRNVIMYFDLETRRRVVETFHEKLRPGGYLLLGHSESLINVSSAFELRHLRGDLVYRRPAPGDPPCDTWRAAAEAAATRAEWRRNGA